MMDVAANTFGGTYMSFDNGQVRISAGSDLFATAANSTWFSLVGITSLTGSMVVNGSATNGSTGTQGWQTSSSADIGGALSTGFVDAAISECAAWPLALNSTQYANVSSNQRSRLGF